MNMPVSRIPKQAWQMALNKLDRNDNLRGIN
jgi:hypothetical protein